jgi:arylformamidase
MRRSSDIGRGDPYNVIELRFTTHLLTHLDAPRHFFPEGYAVDEIPTERFVSDAMVIEVKGDAVLPEHVPERAAGVSLLYKTRNSDQWDPRLYDPEHVYISGAAAEAMALAGANLVGIDYLSADPPNDATYPAHNALLGAGIPILEGIDLSGVEPGRYTLIALPLKISGGDGSPVRAVLLPWEE